MTEVVYSACYGGFGLSLEAQKMYLEKKSLTPVFKDVGYTKYYTDEADVFSDCDIDRADPDLVTIVKELGDKANGEYAKLRIEDVPKGTLYRIDEYDGFESVMTQDAYDWKIAQ